MNKKDYFQKLNVGFIQRLRHNEFGQLIQHIILIPQDDVIEENRLSEAYTKIRSVSQKVSDVRLYNRKHELSDVLLEDAARRREHLISLMKSIQAGALSVSSDHRRAANVLLQWVRPVRRLFNYPGIEIQSRLVNDLEAARSVRPDIAGALETLSLDEHFEFILEETEVIEENFIKRNNDLAANKLKVKALRNEIYVSLRIFIAHVEGIVNIDGSGEHFCHRWFREIEKLLDYYHARLKSRTTIRKKGNEDSDAVEGDTSSTGPDNDVDTPLENDVDDNGNLDESND